MIQLGIYLWNLSIFNQPNLKFQVKICYFTKNDYFILVLKKEQTIITLKLRAQKKQEYKSFLAKLPIK